MSANREEYERWLMELSLDDVLDLFRENNASELLYKVLPRNANSKNQVYVGPDLSQLGKIPSGSVVPVESTSEKTTGRRGPIFRAPVSLEWIAPSGALEPARGTKLIAYPQYPEVRLSGFLKGCRAAPSFLFNTDQCGYDDGRILFLGPRLDGTVLALALPAASPVARALRDDRSRDSYGVFWTVPLRPSQEGHGLALLMRELCRIHRMGWHKSRRLNKHGVIVACTSDNCGGYTLEALLGIRSNGLAEPDFHGWEVKARKVPNIEKPGGSKVTLFTPNPDGGYFAKEGGKQFVRMWGYADTKGKLNRVNLGGVYRNGADFNARTNLKLMLDGYDDETGITKANGAIRLLDRRDREAASWSFAKLMGHWKTKHAHAVYVPCTLRRNPGPMYSYADTVHLAEGAEFRLFLKAVFNGTVNYDPGSWVIDEPPANAASKIRNQFRIANKDITSLYVSNRWERTCT